jgi:hypothetical protein
MKLSAGIIKNIEKPWRCLLAASTLTFNVPQPRHASNTEEREKCSRAVFTGATLRFGVVN